MNFYIIHVHKHFTQIWLDTPEVRAYIAEIIYINRRGWELHMRTAVDILKQDTVIALRAFAAEQINTLKILDRLTS